MVTLCPSVSLKPPRAPLSLCRLHVCWLHDDFLSEIFKCWPFYSYGILVRCGKEGNNTTDRKYFGKVISLHTNKRPISNLHVENTVQTCRALCLLFILSAVRQGHLALPLDLIYFLRISVQEMFYIKGGLFWGTKIILTEYRSVLCKLLLKGQ